MASRVVARPFRASQTRPRFRYRKHSALLHHPRELPPHRPDRQQPLLLRAVEPERVPLQAAVPQDPLHLLPGVHHGQVQQPQGGQQGQGQDLLPGNWKSLRVWCVCVCGRAKGRSSGSGSDCGRKNNRRENEITPCFPVFVRRGKNEKKIEGGEKLRRRRENVCILMPERLIAFLFVR